ncbi:hypothetical protein Tco_1262451 [Tanacetum coccineum]
MERRLRDGEEVVTCKLYLGLAFTIPTLERVTIGCCKVDGGGGGGGGVVAGGVGVVCGDGVGRGVGGVDCGVVCGVVCQGPDNPQMIERVLDKDRLVVVHEANFVMWKGVEDVIDEEVKAEAATCKGYRSPLLHNDEGLTGICTWPEWVTGIDDPFPTIIELKLRLREEGEERVMREKEGEDYGKIDIRL